MKRGDAIVLHENVGQWEGPSIPKGSIGVVLGVGDPRCTVYFPRYGRVSKALSPGDLIITYMPLSIYGLGNVDEGAVGVYLGSDRTLIRGIVVIGLWSGYISMIQRSR